MTEGVWIAVVSAVPPTVAALAALRGTREARAQVSKVQDQLRPNGGSTFRDAMDRVERKVDDLRREVHGDRERQDHLAARVDEGLREHGTFRDRIAEALHLHTRC